MPQAYRNILSKYEIKNLHMKLIDIMGIVFYIPRLNALNILKFFYNTRMLSVRAGEYIQMAFFMFL
jgi:hypothetical protein